MTTLQNDVTIRPMSYKDVDAIYEIDRKLTGEDRTLNLTEEERAVTLADLLTGSFDLSFVAEIEGHVIGFILAKHSYVGEPVIDAGLIQAVGILPDYQRQSIGNNLLNELIMRSKTKGIKVLRVILRERDSRLKDFFSGTGFSRASLVVYDKVL
ncbi:MAG TPA: GNAT family N-acetyltransferase [Dehalococcoidales bacterium]|nr:GNAT family N-acetyltransferase [Dehalococcoidales bacterium]